MNIFLRIIAVVFLFMIVGLVQVEAQATFTRVRGNVYDQNNGGAGVGGLTVTVVCNGNTKTDVTNSSGLYVVDYTFAECNKYNSVTSTVTFNSETQSQTVFVSASNTATLDFYYGAFSTPEFGSVMGVVTALGSGLVFLGLRKKYS